MVKLFLENVFSLFVNSNLAVVRIFTNTIQITIEPKTSYCFSRKPQ